MPPRRPAAQTRISDALSHTRPSRTARERCAKDTQAAPGRLPADALAPMQQVLRNFDLNMNYGPILGIPRTERLGRAQRFNLPVDPAVSTILQDSGLLAVHPELDLNMWHDLDRLI